MARRTSRSDDKVVAGCAPATAALPETQSYYRSSIDAARRDSQNSSHRQYHAANSLYRTPSVTSFSAAAPSSSPGAGLAPKPQTRTAAPDAPLPSNIDDDIARGLAEEDTGRRSYSGRGSSWRGDGDENNTASGSFVPQRNARKTQSILPPAGFFAPKKPPQLASRTSPLPGQASAQLPHSSSTSTSRSGAYLQAMDTASVGDAVSHPLNGSSQSDAWLDSRDAASAKARTSPSIKSTSSAQGMAAERYPMTPSHVATSLSLRKGETDEFEAGPAPSVREQASRDALLQASERSHDPRTVQDEQRSSRRLSPMGTGFSHPTAASHARPSNEKRAPASSSQAAPARADGGIARQRRYKTHRGGNRFFLCGLIMTSDDNLLAFLGSLILMIGLPVLWLVFDAPYTWRHVSPAPVIVLAYLYAVSFSSMWYVARSEVQKSGRRLVADFVCVVPHLLTHSVTSLRDPGVLPRDLDPDPPCTAGEGTGFVPPSDPLAIPVPRIVRVRHGTDLKVKWCDTCGTYRPPRTSHCRVCDNCVENIGEIRQLPGMLRLAEQRADLRFSPKPRRRPPLHLPEYLHRTSQLFHLLCIFDRQHSRQLRERRL